MTKLPTRVKKTDPLDQPVIDPTAPATPDLLGTSNNLPKLSADASATFEDTLAQREGILARFDALVEAADRAVATDQETSGRCSDLIRQIQAANKYVDDTRKAVKEPYFEAGKAVDDAARKYATRLVAALNKVRTSVETFARAEIARQQEAQRKRDAEEAKRREEEEARRKEAEEKGEVAPEPMFDPTPAPRPEEPKFVATGDYGSKAHTTKVWKAEVEDWPKAFKAVQDNEGVREAIQRALQQRVKAGDRKIAGVRIFQDVGLRVR